MTRRCRCWPRAKTATGRAWVYVRDDAPFGGPDPPVALFHYSRDPSGDHPVEHLRTFTGILQADVYAGYNRLYAAGRSSGPVTEAACWAHSRRKFFELADIAAGKGRGKNAPPISPLALEAVKRIDVLFDIERGINGKAAEQRLAVRQELSAPVLADLKGWMQAERRKLSRHSPVAKAMDYMLRRWDLFARFLDDGRICLTNNAAERALRGIALGRKSWLFAGSDRGGVRAAAMYTLIGTAKLNNVDPQAWLADVLDRIAGTPQSQLDELLPWNWQDSQRHDQAASAETFAWRFLTGNAPPPNSAPNTPRPSADAYGAGRGVAAALGPGDRWAGRRSTSTGRRRWRGTWAGCRRSWCCSRGRWRRTSRGWRRSRTRKR